ncbi:MULTISPECIES: hypothetical protein [unclassified Prochlorococcus]|uniref:hypothetical protein n=1 Tax=unclassified Prochlorococcus TaxID=2627481 RepID=UPI000533849E|nr:MULTISPECIES: hypothetical protein [unclassified Prochlorococcus]KGG25424.1 hypothetical protein EV12_2372 [Prochlorococcus sp. MIT 0701]KGG26449.1 hypothetical protein EV13_2583 [Prochlorococcus sp. MIT 0702]KGG31129.1 hypothetical protein EV14_2500 [Prochlorococcus sp. MIT 0703]
MASRRYQTQSRSLPSTNDHQTRHGSSHTRRFNSDFERDLAAMNRVWRMLQQGTIRWLGEIGRQY